MIRSMVKLKSRIDAALVLAQGTLFSGQKAKNSMSTLMMHKVQDFFKIRTQASYTNCDKLKTKNGEPFQNPCHNYKWQQNTLKSQFKILTLETFI